MVKSNRFDTFRERLIATIRANDHIKDSVYAFQTLQLHAAFLE